MACRLDGAVRKCARLPVPCCQGELCGTRCWDTTDCGGAACVDAYNTYCTGISMGPTLERRCAEPAGTCTKDSDCKGNEAGGNCVWNGKYHQCGRPTPGCLPG